MRAAFINTLIELARQDKNIYLLVAEVGFRLVEPFREEFPERFINTGIAEQNMVGIAAGLALSGKTVFAYSIANFPTARCIEQIRNDVCYHNCSVKIVSSGAGLLYGALGVTHHVTEDMGLMRALPGMTVISPADPAESALATRAAATTPGPFYLRLSRTGDAAVHREKPSFAVGKAIRVRDGSGLTLIATGGILANACRAAEELGQRGISTRVLSMHTVKPLDCNAVLAAASDTGAILTVEEHSIMGGLGSAVAEVLAENESRVPFKRLGVPDEFCRYVGSQEYLRKLYSLTAPQIAAEAEALLAKR